MEQHLRTKLIETAHAMRRDILDMSLRCGAMGAHLGGSMSCVEILAVLYGAVMHLDPADSLSDERDRFIMSKAHSSMAHYAALRQAGFLSAEDISSAMVGGELLFKHPKMNMQKGIEFSGGSLGMGLSLGVGTALALRMRGNGTAKVYVLLGDGECDEGSVFEAAAAGAHYNLANLTVIVDRNGLQNDGPTEMVMNKSGLARWWKAMGYTVFEADGHDVESLFNAFANEADVPRLVLANTVKGKGVSFAENITDWHAAYLTQTLYDKAVAEWEDA